MTTEIQNTPSITNDESTQTGTPSHPKISYSSHIIENAASEVDIPSVHTSSNSTKVNADIKVTGLENAAAEGAGSENAANGEVLEAGKASVSQGEPVVETENRQSEDTDNGIHDEFLEELGLQDDVFIDGRFGWIDSSLTEDGEEIELQPIFPRGEYRHTECQICYTSCYLHLRKCCEFAVCDECMDAYITEKVKIAHVRIECLNPDTNACPQLVHREEIVFRLDPEMRTRFNQFLIDANKDPHIKTCPRCSTVQEIDKMKLKDKKLKKRGIKVNCDDCELEWCFPCQAPWHDGISCKDYVKGDRLLKDWSKQQQNGQVNARRCPKCKFFIQRSSGCDHMTCNRCNTEFCYRCGDRFLKIKFIGHHYSQLSIFGCKYRLWPEHPARRKFVRGAVFGGKLLLVPIVGGLAVGAGALLLGLSIFIVPAVIGVKVHKKRKLRRMIKENKENREAWLKRVEEMRQAGDPYISQFNHLKSLGYNPYNAWRNERSRSSARLRRIRGDDDISFSSWGDLSEIESSSTSDNTDPLGSAQRHTDVELHSVPSSIKVKQIEGQVQGQDNLKNAEELTIADVNHVVIDNIDLDESLDIKDLFDEKTISGGLNIRETQDESDSGFIEVDQNKADVESTQHTNDDLTKYVVQNSDKIVSVKDAEHKSRRRHSAGSRLNKADVKVKSTEVKNTDGSASDGVKVKTDITDQVKVKPEAKGRRVKKLMCYYQDYTTDEDEQSSQSENSISQTDQSGRSISMDLKKVSSKKDSPIKLEHLSIKTDVYYV